MPIITNSLTSKTYVSDGTIEVLEANFALGYIRKEHIYMILISDDEIITQLPHTWINDDQLQLDDVLPVGVTYYMRRIVPRHSLVNQYTSTALLKALNLDDSHKQALMILEELSDGYADFYQAFPTPTQDFIAGDGIDILVNSSGQGLISSTFTTDSISNSFVLSAVHDDAWLDMLVDTTVVAPDEGSVDLGPKFVTAFTNLSDGVVEIQGATIDVVILTPASKLASIPPNATVGIKKTTEFNTYVLFGDLTEDAT